MFDLNLLAAQSAEQIRLGAPKERPAYEADLGTDPRFVWWRLWGQQIISITCYEALSTSESTDLNYYA